MLTKWNCKFLHCVNNWIVRICMNSEVCHALTWLQQSIAAEAVSVVALATTLTVAVAVVAATAISVASIAVAAVTSLLPAAVIQSTRFLLKETVHFFALC